MLAQPERGSALGRDTPRVDTVGAQPGIRLIAVSPLGTRHADMIVPSCIVDLPGNYDERVSGAGRSSQAVRRVWRTVCVWRGRCWCDAVPLTEQTQAPLLARYADCLGPRCLGEHASAPP